MKELSVAADLIKQNQYDKAAQILEPLAVRNNPKAEFMLGVLYIEGHGVPQDIKRARELISRAKEHGHDVSQFYLDFLIE